MKVSQLLSLGFAAALTAAFVAGAIGIAGMRALQRSGEALYDRRIRGIEYAHRAMDHFGKMRQAGRDAMISSLYDDIKGTLDSQTSFEDHAAQFAAWLNANALRANGSDLEELDGFRRRILELFSEIYEPGMRLFFSMVIDDIPAHHHKLFINVKMASLSGTARHIENLLTGLINLNMALADQANRDNARMVARSILVQIILLAVMAAVSHLLSSLAIRRIADPIDEVVATLEDMAAGNYAVEVKGQCRGEFQVIRDAVNHTARQVSLHLEEKLQAERLAHESVLAKARAEAHNEAVMAGIQYAGRLQRSLLPPEAAMRVFTEHAVLWKPRNLVGGDLYWLKTFGKGTVLCVCDCTGHGTSGALLTMVVASTLEAIVHSENCDQPDEIVWKLDRRLACILGVDGGCSGDLAGAGRPDAAGADREGISGIKNGCDLAVLFIHEDGSLKISTARIPVFLCDGREVHIVKGQPFFVGEGAIGSGEEVHIHRAPPDPARRIYVASDGLFDQKGHASSRLFGYKTFRDVILDGHQDPIGQVTGAVWEAFEKHRGAESRRDDVQLVAFRP